MLSPETLPKTLAFYLDRFFWYDELLMENKLTPQLRFFEYFLHLAYRLDVRKWRVNKGESDKLKERKKKIQQKFIVELGLQVNQPRSCGVGSSNNGNTARRFFDNAEKSAEITGYYKNNNLKKKLIQILFVRHRCSGC